MANLLDMTMGEKLFEGGFVFILGILVVFLGIAMIVAVISIVGKIISSASNRPKKAVEEKTEEVVSQDSTDEIPQHVKVAIVAAITAYYFNTNSNCEFTVKKIKRI